MRIEIGCQVRFDDDPPDIQPFEVLEVNPASVRVTHPDWKFSKGLLKDRLITQTRPITAIVSQQP